MAKRDKKLRKAAIAKLMAGALPAKPHKGGSTSIEDDTIREAVNLLKE